MVLNRDQVREQDVPSPLLPHLHRHHELAVLDRVAQAVDRADGCDDHDVFPLQQARSRPQAQGLDVLVDGRVLLDVGVRRGDVCLRLVVVVVRDEVFHRVSREERLELAVELSRQCLVVREDQSGARVARDHARHGDRLAGAGDPEEGLIAGTALETARQLLDRRRLISRRLEGHFQLEYTHGGKVLRSVGDGA